jgi:hypothetical protein
MERRGFTRRELHEVFHLDPDRPEDRPAMAALQASLARQLDESSAPAGHRSLRDIVRQMLRKQGRHAA